MHHQSVRISLAVLTQNEDKSPLGHNKDLGAFVPWALVSEEQESEKSFVEALPFSLHSVWLQSLHQAGWDSTLLPPFDCLFLAFHH